MNEKELKKKMIDCDYWRKADLAKAIGCTYPTFLRKIRGEHDFSLSEVEKIANELKMSMQDVNVIFFNNELTEQ